MVYHDRFKPSWQKILFRSDKKTQAAELNELQSVVHYQQTNAWRFLLSTYRVVNGLKTSVLGFTTTGYTIEVGAGVAFLALNDRSYFLRVPRTVVQVPYNTRTTVGLQLVEEVVDRTKDFFTGGELYGDAGAQAKTARGVVVTNTDSFPVVVIDGKSSSEYPYFFRYKPEGYSLNFEESYTASILTDYLATRIHEEVGNVITEGLELYVATSTSFTVNSGKAYIEGKLINLAYPSSFRLPRANGIYNVYLTKYGGLVMEAIPSRAKASTILLGVAQYSGKVLSVVSTNARTMTNNDIKLLKGQSLRSEQGLLAQLLIKQAVTKVQNQTTTFTGLFTDSFISLDNSDIFSKDYDATIDTAKGLLRPAATVTSIDSSNLQEVSSSNTTTRTIQGDPHTLTPVVTTSAILEQERATSFLSLTSSGTTASLVVTPPNGTADTTTKTFTFTQDTTDAGNLAVAVDGNVVSTLKTTTVTIRGIGYSPLADNLSITFGDVSISTFTILEGSAGASPNTVKATISGSVRVSFSVPGNLPIKQYAITLQNGDTTASALLRPPSQSSTVDYHTPSSSSIAQTFTITSGVVVTAVDLSLRSIPPTSTDNTAIALVSITSTTGNTPTSTVLGQGTLLLQDVTLSPNGTVWSSTTLEQYTYLPPGQYAILVTTLVQPLQLFFAEVGAVSLSSSSTSGLQPLTGGELLVKTTGVWDRHLSRDLTFRLIQAVPTSTYSEVVYSITNPLGKIHNLQRRLASTILPGTRIEYAVSTGGAWVPLAESMDITNDTSSLELKVSLYSSAATFPIVHLDRSTVHYSSNRTQGVWISKTLSYPTNYKNVELEFTYHTPLGTTIAAYFSSNVGQTWEALALVPGTVKLLDGNLDTYEATYSALNLPPTVLTTDIVGASSQIARSKVAFKLELSTKIATTTPYVRNLKALVY